MRPAPMTLRALLDDPVLPEVGLSGLCEDSRLIEPGEAFVAVGGAATDGHSYAAEAIERGAVCVLAERQLQGLGAPVIAVRGLRERRGSLAARLYGHPSGNLRCVGVTGTNGKTSIAHHLADLAGGLGYRAGYLGTLGWGELGHLSPSALTTGDAIATQKRLACLRDRGCAWACLEVSSHALAQRRADDVRFEYAVFSNLTRDHLDYHAGFADYGAAKRRLFEFDTVRVAVVNVDDAFGRALAGSLHGPEVITFGRGRADLSWDDVEYHAAGLKARISSPWGTRCIDMPAFGEFALANVTAAIGVLAAAGLSFTQLVEQAQTLTGVPGRMEFFREPGMPTVVVDYAHTPDAVANALAALVPHCKGRLICVIGCGGNRDAGKRPLMAQAAVSAADAVWLTSDNPRWEDPQAIIRQMRAGVPDAGGVCQEVDRGAAISRAIGEAGPDDLVVVAGKGHECSQEIRGCHKPFSDREAVRLALGGVR